MTQPPLLDEALQRAATVAGLIQGEVLAVEDACVVLADAAAPLSPAAAQVSAVEGVDAGIIVVPYAVDDVVLLTQTCDLQRTTSDDYRCLVAPLVRVTTTRAREALRGRRPGLAGLPWIDGESVADLSRITTVERSLVVGARSRGRPRNSMERLHFAETVSRYITRPALPDPVNEALEPLVRRIAEKHDRQSPEGRCANTVAELRVEASPDIDAEEPALNVLMILEETDLPGLPPGVDVDDSAIDALVRRGLAAAAEAVEAAVDAVAKRVAWTAVAECWIKPSADCVGLIGGVAAVEITVMNGEELSYARSRNAPILDLRFLSTRAA